MKSVKTRVVKGENGLQHTYEVEYEGTNAPTFSSITTSKAGDDTKTLEIEIIALGQDSWKDIVVTTRDRDADTRISVTKIRQGNVVDGAVKAVGIDEGYYETSKTSSTRQITPKSRLGEKLARIACSEDFISGDLSVVKANVFSDGTTQLEFKGAQRLIDASHKRITTPEGFLTPLLEQQQKMGEGFATIPDINSEILSEIDQTILEELTVAAIKECHIGEIVSDAGKMDKEVTESTDFLRVDRIVGSARQISTIGALRLSMDEEQLDALKAQCDNYSEAIRVLKEARDNVFEAASRIAEDNGQTKPKKFAEKREEEWLLRNAARGSGRGYIF